MSIYTFITDQKRLQNSVLIIFLGLIISLFLFDLTKSQNKSYMEDKNLLAQIASAQDKSNDALLSFDFKNITIKEAFELLARKIDVGFSYNPEIIPDKRVNFSMKNVPPHAVIYRLLEGTNLEPVLPPTKDVIVIREKEPSESVYVVEQNISGTITDSETGEALPGVNVIAGGTESSSTIGTTTDMDGRYEIELPDDISTLVFTFVGYQRLEVVIDDRSEINIELEQDVQLLEDVVVVGYGVQEKSDITGSVSSISERALQEVPVTSPSQMLQGRAAGVDVLSAGNKPGDGVSIQIRGRRSFAAGNDPLFVVDGIPVPGVTLNSINPNDITSIDILKDASATAIYGSRGANGVIIVTTRKGETGGVNINYSSYVGVRKIMRYPDLMTATEFAEWKRESRRSNGLYDDSDPNADATLFHPIELESLQQGRETDWVRMIIKDGFTQNQNLSVSGGSENTRFSISLGYFDDIGIIPNQRFSRYNARINLDQSIGEKFDIGISTIGTFSEENGTDVDPLFAGGSDYGAYSENPLGVPYDENGELIFRNTPGDGNRTNPLADINTEQVVNRQKIFRLLSSIYAEYEILDGLGLRMNFGPDISQYKKGDFRGSLTRENAGGPATAAVVDEFDFSYTWENILNYNATFAQSHRLGFTGLYSIQSQQLEGYGSDVIGLPLDSFEYYNMGAASTLNTISSSFEKSTIESYMARFNYVYDDRYLVTLTGRADGSSKFAEGNKWGYFPSFALGWNITNESFFEPNDIISNLKLRLSYGKTGNQGINPYQTQGLLARTAYLFGDTPSFGFEPSSIRNNDLKWETTSSFNIGLDFDLMSSRITGSIEVYQSNTTDLLLPRLLPNSSGFSSILTNVGATRNTGVEFSISTFNVTPSSSGGFSWNTDLNLFHNKEEIVELSQGKVDDVGNQRFIGHPINVFYDYEKIGIWQLGEEEQASQFNSAVGQIKVKDANGNGRIDPDDRQILGSDVPDISGGLTNRFGYKGFDLAIVTYFRLGHMVRHPSYGQHRWGSGRVNQLNYNYWTENNPTNDFPQPNTSLVVPLFGSSLSYVSGSYFKVRNITLGYNIAPDLAQKLSLKSLRLYVSVQNPLFISSYITENDGIDPEFPTRGTPVARTFLTGININF